MTSAFKPLMVAGISAMLATAASAQEIDWTNVDATLGRKAAVTADVHRYAFPRTDLNVTLDGIEIKPALAALYEALSPAQRKKADGLLTGMGCMT